MTKLLYISSAFLPADGGAEISSHSLLRSLKKTNSSIDVNVITQGFKFQTETIDEMKIIRVPGVYPQDEIVRISTQINPDIMLTQLGWSDITIKFAKKNKIPSVLYIHSIGGGLKAYGGIENPDFIVANSKFTKVWIKEAWNRDSTVVYPLIDFLDYEVNPNSSNVKEYISLVNPVDKKGGRLFVEIARLLPRLKFLYKKF